MQNTGWLKVGPFLTPVNKHRPGVWNIGCVGSEVARQLYIWYNLTEYHFRTYTHSYRYQCLELSRGKFSCAHEWYCGCLFSKLRSNDANEHQPDTRVSTKTVHQDSINLTSCLTGHNKPMNGDKKTICTHRLYGSRVLFFNIMTSKSITQCIMGHNICDSHLTH